MGLFRSDRYTSADPTGGSAGVAGAAAGGAAGGAAGSGATGGSSGSNPDCDSFYTNCLKTFSAMPCGVSSN